MVIKKLDELLESINNADCEILRTLVKILIQDTLKNYVVKTGKNTTIFLTQGNELVSGYIKVLNMRQ